MMGEKEFSYALLIVFSILVLFRSILAFRVVKKKISYADFDKQFKILTMLTFIAFNVINIFTTFLVDVESEYLKVIITFINVYLLVMFTLDFYEKYKTKEYIGLLEKENFTNLKVEEVFEFEKSKFQYAGKNNYSVQKIKIIDGSYSFSYYCDKTKTAYALSFKKSIDDNLERERMYYFFEKLNKLTFKNIEELKEQKVLVPNDELLFSYRNYMVHTNKDIKVKHKFYISQNHLAPIGDSPLGFFRAWGNLIVFFLSVYSIFILLFPQMFS